MLKIFFLILLIFKSLNALALENCKWDNRKGVPCITVSKTPNSSYYNQENINKIIISKKDILSSGAIDTVDVFKLISGLDVFQSGQRGQQTSIFTRGSESNQTLVLLNGIAINDQSVTDGMHDFGQDFVQTIQQIEIYKGSNGAHFGPSAIAGAINFVTDLDYTNSLSLSGFNSKNNSYDGNYSKITNNGWHLNVKGAYSQNETDSAIAKGNENDGSENYQINFNTINWINDNLKFKSTFYSRATKAAYDNSSTDESGYHSDNKMYALQSGIERVYKNFEDNLIFHYHKYDRQYENGGFLDEYYSQSLVTKAERKIKTNEKLSFGYGSQYTYDWGNFENRGSYFASTRGHVSDLGFFLNAGFKLNENRTISYFGRLDDHKTTGMNETYKFNLSQILGNLKFTATHSTGLRNPTLYELFGSDKNGFTGNKNLNSEKSKTNEIYGEYLINKNLKFSSTAYKTNIFDRIELNSGWSAYENKLSNIDQEGIESQIDYNNESVLFSVFTNFSKSRSASGSHQSRRPDLSYGFNFGKKYFFEILGEIDLKLNYKYTGKFLDWDGSANTFQKSTNLADLMLSKNILGNIFTLNISNFLNERYEKPATYSQDGRQIRFGFKRSY